MLHRKGDNNEEDCIFFMGALILAAVKAVSFKNKKFPKTLYTSLKKCYNKYVLK